MARLSAQPPRNSCWHDQIFPSWRIPSKEIEPPFGFRFDTSPSPLHPALQADILGVNPFRSQRAWTVSDMRSGGKPSSEVERVPCTLLRTAGDSSPEFSEAGLHQMAGPSFNSICAAPLAGNLGSALLAACRDDAWHLDEIHFFYTIDVISKTWQIH